MSICSLFVPLSVRSFECSPSAVRLVGLEPTTPRLSSACSNQLSYSRLDALLADAAGEAAAVMRVVCVPALLRFGLDLSELFYSLSLHRKEVFQPQVPLRLPCYDFIPVTSLSLGPCLLAVGS